MLHDPEMECTCDGENCHESVFLPMSWSTGGYDLRDSKAEAILSDNHNWLTEGESHYCESCRKDRQF